MNNENCKNCDAMAEGNFCANCGQKTQLQRLSFATLIKDISDNIFQINHGLFYSIIEFTCRPAKSVENYLANKRKQYFQPIAYAFTLASLYFLLSKLVEHNTYFDSALEGFVLASTDMESDKALIDSLSLLTQNYAISALALVPIFSLATYIVFFNERRNYLEHVVLNLYITGHQSLIYALFSLFSIIVKSNDLLEILTLAFSVSYATYVLVTFFRNGHGLVRIFKVGISYLISLTLAILTLGIYMVPFKMWSA